MLSIWKFILISLLVTASSVVLANPLPIKDPDAFASEIIGLMAKNRGKDAANAIATTVGRPDSVDPLTKALGIFEGKKFDYTKKVIDKEYSGALRQIIYLTYVDGFTFVYFRFNFKMTSRGWILSNFFYKDEAQDLFPKDLVAPS